MRASVGHATAARVAPNSFSALDSSSSVASELGNQCRSSLTTSLTLRQSGLPRLGHGITTNRAGDTHLDFRPRSPPSPILNFTSLFALERYWPNNPTHEHRDFFSHATIPVQNLCIVLQATIFFPTFGRWCTRRHTTIACIMDHIVRRIA